MRASFCCTSWNLASGVPNCSPPPHVGQRFGQRSGRHAAGGGGHGGPQPIERREPEAVAASLVSQQGVGGKAAAVEGDLAQRMRRAQHLGPREAEPGRVGRHQEAADSLGALGSVGRGEHGVEIGDPRVGDQRLAAVQDVAVALPPGGGRERGDVGPGAGLGHGEGGHHLARGDRPEPALPLRRRAGEQHRRGAQGLQGEHRVGERRRLAERLAQPGSRRGDRARRSAGASRPCRAAPSSARASRRATASSAGAARGGDLCRRRRPRTARRTPRDAARGRSGSV